MGCKNSKEEPPKKQEKVSTIKTSTSGVTLHYFDLYGRAEVIRMALKYLKIDYTENVVSMEEWQTCDKTPYEFGQLPCLEVDNTRLVTSRAILRYICMKNGLYPEDNMEVYKVESICDLVSDALEPLIPLVFANNTEGVENYYREKMPSILEMMENRLKQNTSENHFLEDKTSMADFVVFEFLYDFFMSASKRDSFGDLLEEVPVLKKFAENFMDSSEELKEYLSTRQAKFL